jgi:hypothetical protein
MNTTEEQGIKQLTARLTTEFEEITKRKIEYEKELAVAVSEIKTIERMLAAIDKENTKNPFGEITTNPCSICARCKYTCNDSDAEKAKLTRPNECLDFEPEIKNWN